MSLAFYADAKCSKENKIGDLDHLGMSINPGFVALNHEKRVRIYARNESRDKYYTIWSESKSEDPFWHELLYYRIILKPQEVRQLTIIYNPRKGQEDMSKWPKVNLFDIHEYPEHPDEYARKAMEKGQPSPPVTAAELEAATS